VSYDPKQKLFNIASETDGVPGEISEDNIKETVAANVSTNISDLLELYAKQ
jgi:hypothetical protein